MPSTRPSSSDGGFSIFYMSVNIGGLLGPLLTGWAQREWGFHLAFGLAAAGLKHSVPGDFNLFTADQVQAAMGDGGFDIRR